MPVKTFSINVYQDGIKLIYYIIEIVMLNVNELKVLFQTCHNFVTACDILPQSVYRETGCLLR